MKREGIAIMGLVIGVVGLYILLVGFVYPFFLQMPLHKILPIGIVGGIAFLLGASVYLFTRYKGRCSRCETKM